MTAPLSPNAMRVLDALRRRAGPSHQIIIGHGALAAETGLPRGPVKDAIRQLDTAGLIVVEHRVDERGSAPSRYRLQ